MEPKEQQQSPTQENGPPLKFAIRSSSGPHQPVFSQLYGVNPAVSKDTTFNPIEGTTAMKFSKDGSLLVIVTQQKVSIYNSETGQIKSEIVVPNVASIHLSPKGTYLLTWERWTTKDKQDSQASKENLIIWETATGTKLAGFIQKAISPDIWPVIRWSGDETISARIVTNEIQFFSNREWDCSKQVVNRLKQEGLTKFSIAPNTSPPLIGTFSPEKKGQPGSVRLVRYPNLDTNIATKSLWKATTVDFLWNSTGTACLVVTHTDVDKSNKSYYGETGIYYLSADGKTEKQVTLDKEGSVHKCCWSPDGKQFLVIYGYMPARAGLFDSSCNKLVDFYGREGAPRNTAKWSPCGSLLCIAGFGNLNSGLMDIWFVKKLKKVGTCKSPCSSYFGWSPDSSYLMTAVLSPKMTVDNGIKIFKYDGTLYHEEKKRKIISSMLATISSWCVQEDRYKTEFSCEN